MKKNALNLDGGAFYRGLQAFYIKSRPNLAVLLQRFPLWFKWGGWKESARLFLSTNKCEKPGSQIWSQSDYCSGVKHLQREYKGKEMRPVVPWPAYSVFWPVKSLSLPSAESGIYEESSVKSELWKCTLEAAKLPLQDGSGDCICRTFQFMEREKHNLTRCAHT